DLKTNATTCCSNVAMPRYVIDALKLVEDEVVEKFYGCGSPIPPALEGLTVLDLGCGSGRDVYILSKLVGEHGKVIGVDMTDEQINFARSYQDVMRETYGYEKSNISFVQAYIEDLQSAGIADESVDLVVSNCVVNLSPFKDQVFSEIFRVLKPGGELYFSDIYADRRIPDDIREDPVLLGECLGGALYTKDFETMLLKTGFSPVFYQSVDAVHTNDFKIQTKLGFINFSSRLARVFKPFDSDASALLHHENYGQVATYLGTMPETPRYFDFDEDNRFIKGKARPVSDVVAQILTKSRYAKHFEVSEKSEHLGAFDLHEALQAQSASKLVDKHMLKELEDAYEMMGYKTFEERVDAPLILPSRHPHTMQMNIAYKCNLSCSHCYIPCGPQNTESMSKETMEACLQVFKDKGFKTLDITGGSPEYNPHLPWLLEASKDFDEVIVRTNATLLNTKKFEPFIELFAKYKVHLITSLPYYSDKETDAQRGTGSFKSIIKAIRKLNDVGYGKDPKLVLDVVYNVSGPYLPPSQDELELVYKDKLMQGEGIYFTNLFAFNNFALGRFAEQLMKNGSFHAYLKLLADNFNVMSLTKLMCLDQISVDYDGRVYDCEPNHVTGLPIKNGEDDLYITDLITQELPEREIRTNPVCFSCAAGFGSSCGGSLLL
ncbi:MAG: arsenosugar biosynthesis radical SAM protein ArsS, partial [Coriobacteriia bacterium]|nr:arsenosugar biosynthesis radical SAM protein ArsS [Coriobacteriia bacterium]